MNTPPHLLDLPSSRPPKAKQREDKDSQEPEGPGLQWEILHVSYQSIIVKIEACMNGYNNMRPARSSLL